jgi:hypothetical protein
MSENHCESVVASAWGIETAMVGLLSCAPTSRWDFLQSRKVTFLDNPLSAIFCLKGYSHRGRWEGNLN